ncbi:MAG: hypothetical protein ABF820_10715 [Sporolactobacillus sp.]
MDLKKFGDIMNTKQFQNAIAYSAISFGKLIAAIGQTPIEKLDPDLQNDLVFTVL